MREYLEAAGSAFIGAVQGRYPDPDPDWGGAFGVKGSRKDKGRILDQFTRVTGYHPDSASGLLSRRHREDVKSRPKAPYLSERGRAKEYGAGVIAALKLAWEASDRMFSRRLQPFLPELVRVVEQHGELTLLGETRAQLCRMSAATIDRRLTDRCINI